MNGTRLSRRCPSLAWVHRAALSLFACVAAVTLLPLRAGATQVSSGSQIIYDDGLPPTTAPPSYRNYGYYPLCIIVEATLNDQLMSKNSEWTFTSCSQSPLPNLLIPKGNLVSRIVLWAWDSKSSSWYACYDGPTNYSDFDIISQSSWTDLRNVGCKGKYYILYAGNWVWDGKAWQGGWVGTNYIYSAW
jgi:hypothetical protein